MPETPELKQFRIERPGNGILHLVFDMPGRSMNVFSNAAIEELGRFADWLPQADGGASSFARGSRRHFAPAPIWPSWRRRTIW